MDQSAANSPSPGADSGPENHLKKSGVTEIFGTLMILVGILIFLALVSFQSQAPAEGEGILPESNMIGTVGHYSAQLLFFLFGKSAFLLGPYLFLLGFLTFYRGGFTDPLSRVVAALVVMAGTSLLGALIYQVDGYPSQVAGGLLGARVGQAFQVLFGTYGGFILAMGIFLTGVFLAIRIPVPVFLGQLNHRLVTALRGYSAALQGQGQMGYREAYNMAGAGVGGDAPAQSPEAQPEPASTSTSITEDMMHDSSSHSTEADLSFVQKESGPGDERRPWIQRVESESDEHPDAMNHEESDFANAGDSTEADEAQEATAGGDADDLQDLYNDFPEEPETEPSLQIRGLSQRTRLSSNARHLQATLSQIESRAARPNWLEGTRRAPAPGRSGEFAAESAGDEPARRRPIGTPESERDLSGYFNEDESRFHFRTAPGRERGSIRSRAFADAAHSRARSNAGQSEDEAYRAAPARAFAGAGEPNSNHKNIDGAFLEPLDQQLIGRRERREAARAHSLSDLPERSNPREAADAGESAAIETLESIESMDSTAALEATESSAAIESLEATEPPRELEAVEEPGAIEAAEAIVEDAQADVHAAEDDAIESDPVQTESGESAAPLETSPEKSIEPLVETSIETLVEPVPAAPPVQRKARKKPLPVSAVPKFEAKNARRRYHLPGNLLKPAEVPAREDVSREIEVTRERLEKVMQDYGIQARVVRTQRGPIITLYEVKLEAGVRVSRILGISDEIKMNLEAPSIRIIAPIPGKPTVGIEIPNRHREGVVLGDMLDRDVMARNELCVVLGKNIAGEKQYVDLARLPHLLIAGSTGSGKSVYMNAIIASLLYTRSPEDVRFIMIDPKMVELKLFEGIPHLIMPVITDVRQASKALTWVINEMERRYEILSHQKCRDIRSYNDRVAADTSLPGLEASGNKREKMPYLVVFIDELSDLMMVAAKDVEDSIIRLTQKARAVGIHVVMATQRPSVDVITALIKANCPARIAFHVAQKTDSRTILDMNGAETLLGKGDMLYRSPSSTGLVRMQAPLLTEEEIENVVQETARYGEPSYVDLEAYIEEESTEAAENDVDSELLQQAWKIVLESGKTSTSYIQRRLRIGYNRAASLIEMLEQKGYLSPAIGNKPREILKRS
ncbi:MAG: DNA translocase FtsK 4TM domain-containing protein [bacterium]|nr:DNA translocase FtsK 4TM domain-containing protein [bacterium]